MTGLGYAMKMFDDSGHETSRGVDAVGGNKIEDFIEISGSRIGYDQVFRRDRPSPL
jgi:hypothetical protein